MKRRDFVKALGLGGIAGTSGVLTSAAQQPSQLLEIQRSSAQPWPHWAEGRAHRMAMGRNGVVAAADGLASLAGARMLMKGGNAFDAIVAAAAALNVVEPMMSGMCGFGGFMMIHKGTEKKTLALDMMGISPAAASRGNMTERDLDEGYKAPIVWGNIAGWAEVLKAHGTMSLGDVFEPAIELAEGGFPVSAFDVASITRTFEKLSKFPTTARIFLPNGKPPKVGWILKQPDLARSFKRVAADGPEVLYSGALADEIVKFLQDNGGLITKKDLAGFKVRWRQPIESTFQGHRLVTMPPGSCGMTLLQALNIMDGFDLKSMEPYSAEFVHLWLESYKRAFLDDDRYNTGKEIEIPVARLISKAHADEQRRSITAQRVSAFPGAPLPVVGTTSLAAADKFGNAVAFTQSLVNGWGSGVVAGSTGLLLNNGHRFGFVLDANHVNSLAGGQRAKGVMSPTLVYNGDRLLMAIGAAGGYTIPQTVGQSITKAVVYGMDIQQAIASPRMIMNRGGGQVPVGNEAVTFLEPGFPESVGKELEARGHRFGPSATGGVVQGVYIDPESGALGGGSDPRADGRPVAF